LVLPKYIEPEFGFNRPEIKLKMDDLPAPLGPNKPETPAGILKLILFKMFLFPKDKYTFFKETIGWYFLNDFIRKPLKEVAIIIFYLLF